MWRGKEHPLGWVDVRQAANALDEALQTQSLEELVDIVRAHCKEAGFEAARNKRDKNAPLKREDYGMLMDLLQGEKHRPGQ